MQISPFLSQKIRFWSFVSMLCLVFVHGYNMVQTYLQAWTVPFEPLSPTTFTEYFIANGILRFRIPMLFAISGFFFALDKRSNGPRFLRRLQTLGIPYFLWAAIAIGITALIESTSWVGCNAVEGCWLGPFGPYSVAQGTKDEWIAGLTFNPVAFQLWFLRSLLQICFYYFLIDGIGNWMRKRGWLEPEKKGVHAVLSVLKWISISLMIFLWFVPGDLIFYLVQGDNGNGRMNPVMGILITLFGDDGLLPFTIGVWYARRGIPALPPLRIPVWIWGVLWVGLAAGKSLLALWFTQPGEWVFFTLLGLHKLTIFTGLVFAWYGMDGLVHRGMNWKPFVWASSFSFIIYALHVPLLNYTMKAAEQQLPQFYGYRFAEYIGVSTLIIAFCILVGWLLRSTMPTVYGILTGGRGLEKKEREARGQVVG